MRDGTSHGSQQRVTKSSSGLTSSSDTRFANIANWYPSVRFVAKYRVYSAIPQRVFQVVTKPIAGGAEPACGRKTELAAWPLAPSELWQYFQCSAATRSQVNRPMTERCAGSVRCRRS